MLSAVHSRLQELRDDFLCQMLALRKHLFPMLSCIACERWLPLMPLMIAQACLSMAIPHIGPHTLYQSMLPGELSSDCLVNTM